MPTKIAGLYSRVSTEQQVERGSSIPFQKECLEKKSREMGYSFIHYSDEAMSGGTTQRAEFLRMLSDIESEKIQAVIFYELSRTSRNMLDSLLLQETLKKHNVRAISLSENFDLDTDEGDMNYKLRSFINERYRKDLIKRIKAKMWDKAGKGTFCGGQAPYGYDIGEKRLVINERESEIVKEVYNKFEEMRSLRGVTVWLNKMGYKTKRGTTWASASVRRILTNVLYTGYYTYGKRANGSKVYLPQEKWLIVKGDFEPLITKEQFNKVNAVIRQKRFSIPQKKYNEVFILSGLMRCECGGSLNGYTMTKKESGKIYAYYKCHNNTSKGSSVCSGNTLRKDFIERHILEEIRKRADLHFEDAEAKEVLEKEKRKTPQERLKRTEGQIATLKAKQKRLLGLYEDGSISKDLLVERMDKITLELEEVENLYQDLRAELNPKNMGERADLLKKIHRLKSDFLATPNKTTADILRQLVKQITVKRSCEIEIELYQL